MSGSPNVNNAKTVLKTTCKACKNELRYLKKTGLKRVSCRCGALNEVVCESDHEKMQALKKNQKFDWSDSSETPSFQEMQGGNDIKEVLGWRHITDEKKPTEIP